MPNQIVSQLDVLLIQPELFDELCEELIKRHKQNLSENLLQTTTLATQQNSAPNPTTPTYKKFIIPTVIGGTLAALEALRRRKKNNAKKGMSRQMRNAEERKRKEKEAKKKPNK